jgi:hypothetical protein
MAQKKKLQVKEERQAAVEAILTASHIPAGMEIFTAGDQSQIQVMKRWIDASAIPCGPCRVDVVKYKEKRDYIL